MKQRLVEWQEGKWKWQITKNVFVNEVALECVNKKTITFCQLERVQHYESRVCNRK